MHPDNICEKEHINQDLPTQCVLTTKFILLLENCELRPFLVNEEKKKQLGSLLYRVGSSVSAERLANGGTAIVCVEGMAHFLSAAGGKVNLRCKYIKYSCAVLQYVFL